MTPLMLPKLIAYTLCFDPERHFGNGVINDSLGEPHFGERPDQNHATPIMGGRGL